MASTLNASLQPAITVVVRHRDPLLHLGIVAALRDDGRFSVRTDDTLATTGAADVVVADHENGVAFAAATRHVGRPPRVMIVTHRDGETDVRHALSRGVQGYLLLGSALDDLVDGVTALSRGQRYLTQAAAMRAAEHLCFQSLTGREAEVLHFVAAGWSNKMVANELGTAVATVKTHVKAILEKLNARTRTEAAHVAQRRGLLAGDIADVPHMVPRGVPRTEACVRIAG
ncbi:LuxR C-terminal-related transcriptional regulator [Piscinibacter gummiphilus]|uniref:Uncharacterized protein n=1 Tax=Piscinibacter gummiphilus TaxID=946333 RepID=A0A1W6L3D0_9BURK|nr:response regulator transcription factor [Piscinibacter gummiphilus]ARN18710.1 hypothetical protein A4W93_01570 [Piscinibacter gummiphilus]ATU63350.1 DNA-binding response regulator [Piscinibacter gummiphilus]GLS95860.1 putative nitrate/nitrite response transcriptional regulatory protein NarL [Piscinibacter gummiphilus]